MRTDLKSIFLYCFSFLVAFCSLSYELIMAQLLSAVLGGTVAKYSLTIGVFILALGMGSLAVHHPRFRFVFANLFRVELFLSVLGIVTPLFLRYVLFEYPSGWALGVGYVLIFVIGFVSGAELPLLLDLAKLEGMSSQVSGRVIAADYLGMFAATMAFPMVLLNVFGVMKISIVIASFNFILAWVWFLTQRKGRHALRFGVSS